MSIYNLEMFIQVFIVTSVRRMIIIGGVLGFYKNKKNNITLKNNNKYQ